MGKDEALRLTVPACSSACETTLATKFVLSYCLSSACERCCCPLMPRAETLIQKETPEQHIKTYFTPAEMFSTV